MRRLAEWRVGLDIGAARERVRVAHALETLPRLGQARAYQIMGENAKSREAYIYFITIWNEADSDLPIILAARREYSAAAVGSDPE